MNTKQKGVTLVELMTTLAVGIVLMAVGVPMYQSITANNRIISQTNGLVTALNVAKDDAIRAGGDAGRVVCAKSTALVSQTNCGDDEDWANGWHAFTDDDGVVGAFDGSDAVIRHWEPLSGDAVITASTGVFRFLSDGSLDAGAEQTLQMGQTGSVSPARCIRVSVTGVIRTHRVEGGLTCP